MGKCHVSMCTKRKSQIAREIKGLPGNPLATHMHRGHWGTLPATGSLSEFPGVRIPQICETHVCKFAVCDEKKG